MQGRWVESFGAIRGGVTQIIKQDQLPWGAISRELVGAEHGLEISLFFVDAEPGHGVALHKHPYVVVFMVQDGQATFTVDGERQEAGAGDILVVHANQPHAFVNSGQGRLRSIDIHLSPELSKEWLEGRNDA